MACLARGDSRADGRMASHVECESGDVRGADVEAAWIDVRGRMAAGAIAIERADRDVIGARRRDRHVRKGGGNRGGMAAQAARDALVGTGDRVERIVAWSGMTLRAWRVGGYVIGGFGRVGNVRCERRSGRMTTYAVPRSRVGLVKGVRPRVPPRARGACDHALIRCRLVAGLARGDSRGDRRVAGDIEAGTGEIRRTDIESARAHVGRRVATGAIAIECADRDMVIAGRCDRDVREGRGDRGCVAREA